MRRLWIHSIETLLKRRSPDDAPCLVHLGHAPEGLPVTARLRRGRVRLYVSRPGQAPVAAMGRVLTGFDEIGEPVCWVGLPPDVTCGELRRIFRADPCRADLRRLTVLTLHLDDDMDTEDILKELAALRRTAEAHLREALGLEDVEVPAADDARPRPAVPGGRPAASAVLGGAS